MGLMDGYGSVYNGDDEGSWIMVIVRDGVRQSRNSRLGIFPSTVGNGGPFLCVSVSDKNPAHDTGQKLRLHVNCF